MGVGGVFFLFWAHEPGGRLASRALSAEGVRPVRVRGPRLVILSLFLVYPVINTILISFKDAESDDFVGLDNYSFVFTDDSMLRVDPQHRRLDRVCSRWSL